MSQQRIDIATLINKVIDKTDINECQWGTTSTNGRFLLSLPNGSIAIEFNGSNSWGEEYYRLEVCDSTGVVFASFVGDNENNDYYNLFQRLYKSIGDYFTRIQEEKFAKIFDDLK